MASLSASSPDPAADAVVVSTVTRGVALWLTRHWLDKARRKLARAGILQEGEGNTGNAGNAGNTVDNEQVAAAARLDIRDDDAVTAVVICGGHGSDGGQGITEEHLELVRKHLAKATRALVEEDLGDMDATQLRPAIRDSKTGLKDLTELEDRLKVIVFYCEAPGVECAVRGMYTNNHVRLVGAKKTLEKKCSDVRSVLSHYHWRLSGRDVSFSDMVAKE